jgi:hypothetical protein
MSINLDNSVLNCKSNESIKTFISLPSSFNIGNLQILNNNNDDSQVIKMGPGLYAIVSINNQKIYIGESINVASRLGRHWDELTKKRHECQQLQLDWNQFGGRF